MQEDKWLGWAGLIVAFAIFQIVRGVLRGAKNANAGMARLNAAAERILKERSGSASNPIPRTMPQKRSAGGAKPKPQSPALKSRSTPAVIRRDGILSSGGQEPVIQRRR